MFNENKKILTESTDLIIIFLPGFERSSSFLKISSALSTESKWSLMWNSSNFPSPPPTSSFCFLSSFFDFSSLSLSLLLLFFGLEALSPFFFSFSDFLLFLFQLSSQYELWAEQLQNADIPRDLKDTEAQLRNLGEHINHIQTTTFEVAQRGQDLLQVRARKRNETQRHSHSRAPVQILR